MAIEKLDENETVMSTRELRGELSEAIMRAHYGKERIIVTHHGRRFAALISLEHLALLETALAAPSKEDMDNVAKNDVA